MFCGRTLSLNVTLTNGSCILLLLFFFFFGERASNIVSSCHVSRPHLWGSLILSVQSDGPVADITVSGQGVEIVVRCVLWVGTLPFGVSEDTQATV